MILTKTVTVKWNKNNKKYFVNKGYIFTKIGDEFKAKIEDISKGTAFLYNIEVICDCDDCVNNNKPHNITYKGYIENIEINKKYICRPCKFKQINSVINKDLDKYGYKITLNEYNQRICNIDGCTELVRSCGLCQKHYTSMYTYGEIKRGKYDRNEIIQYDNYAELILYNINNEEIERAIIDLEDIEKVSGLKWGYDGKYAVSRPSENGVAIYLHKFVMNVFDNTIVDHISRKHLDCRKENLRIATHQQNSINKSIQSNNTSGVTGVTWDKSKGKWQAYIKLNRKNIFLGRYINFDDAVRAREIAELKYFGEYSPKFNILKEKYIEYYSNLVKKGDLNKYVN